MIKLVSNLLLIDGYLTGLAGIRILNNPGNMQDKRTVTKNKFMVQCEKLEFFTSELQSRLEYNVKN